MNSSEIDQFWWWFVIIRAAGTSPAVEDVLLVRWTRSWIRTFWKLCRFLPYTRKTFLRNCFEYCVPVYLHDLLVNLCQGLRINWICWILIFPGIFVLYPCWDAFSYWSVTWLTICLKTRAWFLYTVRSRNRLLEEENRHSILRIKIL